LQHHRRTCNQHVAGDAAADAAEDAQQYGADRPRPNAMALLAPEHREAPPRSANTCTALRRRSTMALR
jgi:hypothetical protein